MFTYFCVFFSQIFHTLKAPIDKYYATIFLGVAELIGALICVFLVHITGKRPLVFASLIGIGSCFFATATYAYFLDSVPGSSVANIVLNSTNLNRTNVFNDYNITNFNSPVNITVDEYETTTFAFLETTALIDYDEFTTTELGNLTRIKRLHITENEAIASSKEEETENVILPLPNSVNNPLLWLPLTLLLTGALLSHIGIRLIPWMLIGEVFPVAVRSGGSGMSSGIGYLFGFLANKLFLGMVDTLTLAGTFWFYSAVALIGCVILYFVLPETEGKSLNEIELFFGNKSLTDDNENDKANANNMNMVELGRLNNGFDQITIIPPSNGSSRITLRLSSVDAGDPRFNDQRRSSLTNENILPELTVTPPRVGSKRFMKSTAEVRRLSSVNADESTNM